MEIIGILLILTISILSIIIGLAALHIVSAFETDKVEYILPSILTIAGMYGMYAIFTKYIYMSIQP